MFIINPEKVKESQIRLLYDKSFIEKYQNELEDTRLNIEELTKSNDVLRIELNVCKLERLMQSDNYNLVILANFN